MTLFEYLTIAVSIVLALGLVRLVDGLGSAVNPATRYWVHLVAVTALTATHLFYWWSLWIFREGVTWNFGFFAFVVLGALLLYFAASALIPRDPTSVSSWKTYYFGVHRRFFLVATAFVVHTILALLIIRESPLPSTVLPAAVVGVGLNLVGAFSESVRVHQYLAIALCVFIVFLMILWSGPPQPT